MTSRRNILVPTFSYLGLLIALLYLPYKHWLYLSTYCKDLTDYFLLELSVANAKHFEAWNGAYSRLGFRHPGPIHFYWYALFDEISPLKLSLSASHALAQFVLNILVIAGLVHLSLRNFTQRWLSALWLPLFLILFVGEDRSPFGPMSDVWNPYTPPSPTALLILGAAVAFCGDFLGLLYMAIASVLMAQAHLGAVPLAIGIYFCAAVAVILKARKSKLTGKEAAFAFSSGALTLIAWAPPLYDWAIRGPRGNIARILAFAVNAEPQFTLLDAFAKMAPYFTKPLHYVVVLGPWHSTVALLLLTLTWIPGAEDRLYRALRSYLTFAVLLATYSTTKIQGDFFGYLIMYQFGLAACLWILLLWRIALWAAPLTKDFSENSRFYLRVACCALLALSPLKLSGKTLKPLKLCRRSNIQAQFADILPYPDQSFYRFDLKDESIWPFSVELAALMKQRHYHFCFPKRWDFVFEFTQTCAYQERFAENRERRQILVRLDKVLVKAFEKSEHEISYHGSHMSWEELSDQIVGQQDDEEEPREHTAKMGAENLPE